jgi:hypothetical protein
LASKSKIPPQLCGAAGDIGEPAGDGVNAFRFHLRVLKLSEL